MMRPILLAGSILALLLSSHSQAADSSAPFTEAPPRHCAANPDSPPPAGDNDCPPPPGEAHGRLPPPPHEPPHEPPLAAVKACMGKKVGAKTTLYFNGDSIPAVCQPYDGMVLAKPLQPPRPPMPPEPPADAPY